MLAYTMIESSRHRLNMLTITMSRSTSASVEHVNNHNASALVFNHRLNMYLNMLADTMIKSPRHRLNMLTITMSRPTSASVEHVNNHNASARVFNHWLNMYLNMLADQ